MKLFVIFNHTLTPEQEHDAQASLGVDCFVKLSCELKQLWGNIPCETSEIREFINPIILWISDQAQPGDYVLIQGDFGAVWLLVNWAFSRDLIPIYSTTERKANEQVMFDGSIRTVHTVKHCIYRKYGV